MLQSGAGVECGVVIEKPDHGTPHSNSRLALKHTVLKSRGPVCSLWSPGSALWN